MKNSITISIVLTIVSTFSTAVAAEDSPWDFSFSSIWKSKFVSPTAIVASERPVVHSSITATHKDGYYFNLWHSGEAGREIFNRENEYSSEIDLTGGLFGKFDNGIDYDIGVSYWMLSDITDFRGDDDAICLYGKFSKTKKISENQTLTPYFKIKGYLIPSGQADNGFSLFTGAFYNLKLDNKLSVELEGTVGYDSGAYSFDNGTFGKGGAWLNYQVNDNLSAKFGIELWSPFGDMNDSRKFQRVFSAGLTWKF